MSDQSNGVLLSTDTVNMQAGGGSFFDDFGDALTKGVGAAVVSGVSSIINTGIDAVNYFGADVERVNVHKTLEDIDQNWGDYYKAHQGVIDTAGFVGASFIPGGLAVKGLNAFRRGEGAGVFARALNYSTSAQTKNLEAALQVIASPEGSVFTKLNSSYVKALSWGVADQMLQTAAFEVAVTATMKASPMLDGASAGDLVHDITKNILVGGAFGGTLESIFLRGITKDATAVVNLAKRKYDTLPGSAESLGVADSDKAFSIMNAAMAIPKVVEDSDKAISFAYKLNGKVNTTQLNTEELFDKTISKTLTRAYQDFEGAVTNNLALGGDATVGNPVARTLLDIIKSGKKNGVSDEQIRGRLGDYLYNLDRIEPIGDQIPSTKAEQLFYFDKTASTKDFPFKSAKNQAPDGSTAFRLLVDPSELSVATLGKDAPTVKAAWEAGFDLAMKADGTWSVNPKSGRLRSTNPPKGYQTILNTRTGVADDTAVVTVADIATADVPLLVSGDTVVSGGRTFKFSLANGADPAYDSIESTARHLWASKLEKIDGEVSSTDFSVLDRMSRNKEIVSEGTTINIGGDVHNWRDLGNFDQFVFQNKLDVLRQRFEGGEKDIRQLAYELNVEPAWIQDAIASKFNPSLKRLADNAPDLTTGWQRELGDYERRENVILNYREAKSQIVTDDFGNSVEGTRFAPAIDDQGNAFLSDRSHTAFITGIQDYQYRIKLAQDRLELAHASVFGADSAKFLPFTYDSLKGLADGNDAGAGLVSFSNANYGDKLRLFSQETGKQTHLLAQKLASENIAKLQPLMAEIRQDAKASAELTAIVARVRSSAEKYTILGADYGFDGSYLIDKSLIKGTTEETLAAVKDALLTGTQGNLKAFHIENDKVADFLTTHMAVTGDVTEKRAVLLNALGQVSRKDPSTLYVPPVDTAKVPYFAFVRPTEGKAFSTSDVSMITARDPAELLRLTNAIDPKEGLEVIFKKDTERFHKAIGDYNYQRSMSDSAIDSSLKKGNRLGDYLPSFSVESTLEDFLNFHQRQATQLVRDGVSTKYAQTFAELNKLSEQYTVAATSKFGIVDKLFQRSLKDPYDDVIKGALDISKRSEFTLLHQTNEMLDALGTRAYRAAEGAFQKAASGTISWEEANSQLTKYGLGAPFHDKMAFDLATIPADRNLLKTALQKANMILSTATLRLDFANSLINIISTPIMLGSELSSIKNSIKNDPNLVGQLAELTSLQVPGQTAAIPSTTKLIGNAIKNFWGPDKAALLERYKANGDVKGLASQFHEMVEDLSIVPGMLPAKFGEKVNGWVDTAAKWTRSDWAEEFTRFVSADVMRQISDPVVRAGKMSVQEQNAYMSIFTNRVQGNYIASQRPILFQGTLGAALGLFQTYQFNMMQQLFRHIENRDMKSIAVMSGLQGSIYGLNGLPLFEAINTHLIGNAAINDGHKDIYSYTTQAAGKGLGDWMLYGTASAFPLFGDKSPALYTRGDVNPRHITIIPTNPMDVPAVDGSIRFVGNLLNTASKLAQGGNVGATLLEGLEHNSINRPLAGLAQAMQGYSTTSKGSLISTNADFFSVANAGRILGAKPLDESVGLNAKFRSLAYQAEDKAKLEGLGAAVKTTLRGNRAPTDEQMNDFMGKYAAAGGRVENFGRAMQAWSRDANQSVLNTLADRTKSPYGQRLLEVMGGTRIDDFRSQPTIEGIVQ